MDGCWGSLLAVTGSPKSLRPKRKHPGSEISVCACVRLQGSKKLPVRSSVSPSPQAKYGGSAAPNSILAVVCAFVKGARSALTHSSHRVPATQHNRLQLVAPDSEDSLWMPCFLHLSEARKTQCHLFFHSFIPSFTRCSLMANGVELDCTLHPAHLDPTIWRGRQTSE